MIHLYLLIISLCSMFSSCNAMEAPPRYAQSISGQPVEQIQPGSIPSLRELCIPKVTDYMKQENEWYKKLAILPEELAISVLASLLHVITINSFPLKTAIDDVRIGHVLDCLYGLTGKKFTLEDRLTVLVSLLLDPTLHKILKGQFIMVYKAQVKKLLTRLPQNVQREIIHEEFPILAKFESLLVGGIIQVTKKGIEKCLQSCKQDGRSYVVIDQAVPAESKKADKPDSPIKIEFLGGSVIMHLLTHVIPWKNLTLLRVLRNRLGLSFDFTDFAPRSNTIGEIQQNNRRYYAQTHTCVDYAAYTLSPEIMKFVLESVKEPIRHEWFTLEKLSLALERSLNAAAETAASKKIEMQSYIISYDAFPCCLIEALI